MACVCCWVDCALAIGQAGRPNKAGCCSSSLLQAAGQLHRQARCDPPRTSAFCAAISAMRAAARLPHSMKVMSGSWGLWSVCNAQVTVCMCGCVQFALPTGCSTAAAGVCTKGLQMLLQEQQAADVHSASSPPHLRQAAPEEREVRWGPSRNQGGRVHKQRRQRRQRRVLGVGARVFVCVTACWWGGHPCRQLQPRRGICRVPAPKVPAPNVSRV